MPCVGSSARSGSDSGEGSPKRNSMPSACSARANSSPPVISVMGVSCVHRVIGSSAAGPVRAGGDQAGVELLHVSAMLEDAFGVACERLDESRGDAVQEVEQC